jgi:hypothetical protein
MLGGIRNDSFRELFRPADGESLIHKKSIAYYSALAPSGT